MINGQPLVARSAVNVEYVGDGVYRYKLDSGNSVEHRREDGAVSLAHKLLDDIVEVR